MKKPSPPDIAYQRKSANSSQLTFNKSRSWLFSNMLIFGTGYCFCSKQTFVFYDRIYSLMKAVHPHYLFLPIASGRVDVNKPISYQQRRNLGGKPLLFRTAFPSSEERRVPIPCWVNEESRVPIYC